MKLTVKVKNLYLINQIHLFIYIENIIKYEAAKTWNVDVT